MESVKGVKIGCDFPGIGASGAPPRSDMKTVSGSDPAGGSENFGGDPNIFKKMRAFLKRNEVWLQLAMLTIMVLVFAERRG